MYWPGISVQFTEQSLLYHPSIQSEQLGPGVYQIERDDITRGGGLMTTFGDLGNYVNGFTCSPQEI